MSILLSTVLIISTLALVYGASSADRTEFLKAIDPDAKRDPSYQVSRYEHESKYKEWFDKNWGSKYKSIYEAVGLPEPTKTTTTKVTTTTTTKTTTEKAKTETQSKIPSWVKDKALLFGQGKISEDEYLKAIQFLVDNGIVKSSQTSVKNNPTATQPTPQKEQKATTPKPAINQNTQVLTNTDFNPVLTQPDKYKDLWAKLYGRVSQEPMIYDNYAHVPFDIRQGDDYSASIVWLVVPKNIALNLKKDDCLLAEGKILGAQQITYQFTGSSITVPAVSLEKHTSMTCLEAKYPAETSIIVNQSQSQGSLQITVDKIELTKYHVRAFVKVENIGIEDLRFYDEGVIIQGKKQYQSTYISSDYPSVASSIPSGIVEEGILTFQPLPNKNPFQLVFDAPSYWNGNDWIKPKIIFNISP
jgi:hypothetical protein